MNHFKEILTSFFIALFVLLLFCPIFYFLEENDKRQKLEDKKQEEIHIKLQENMLMSLKPGERCVVYASFVGNFIHKNREKYKVIQITQQKHGEIILLVERKK